MVHSPSARPLPASFFQRPTLEVCRDLLGKTLCRAVNGEVIRLPLVELEAYDGPDDLASHASHGRTQRNSAMFEEGGIWYVYLCYGIHWMLNIVTGEKDYPGAILLRSAGDVDGPGKLTNALQVKAEFNGKPSGLKYGLWIEESGIAVPEHQVQHKPRIGVGYAGPLWADKPYRFIWKREAVKPMSGIVGMGELRRK
jgi:DNA-3-methyladenine glycosylase